MDKRWPLTVALVVLMCVPAFADSATANRQTAFNNVTDFVATVGKSEQDKKEILQERRELRHDARLKAEERRKRAAMRQRMREQEQLIMRKIQASP